MRSLKGSVSWVLLAMLSGGQDKCPQDGDCALEEPALFRSVDLLECGLGSDGPVYCYWTIQFEGGGFDWAYSDVAESGTYTCQGEELTGLSSVGTYYGVFDEATGVLTWDGVAYL